MKLPILRGVIERRILVNYRIEPRALEHVLPAPFRPKLISGFGVGGICLIRLAQVRPRLIPAVLGLNSENAAHRIAVEWTHQGKNLEGVFVPRRDTDSRLNSMAGGVFFPGEFHAASFDVREHQDNYAIDLNSRDKQTRVSLRAHLSRSFDPQSVFGTLKNASHFFEGGALGYSATSDKGRFDGIELCCKNWKVEPLSVDHVESSYFDDTSRFAKGSVEFDCALLMRSIDHEWHARDELCCVA